MAGPIQHLVVLMLENRSFDHLLAFSAIPGLAGVDTNNTNPGPNGPVAMSPTAPDGMASDPKHEFEDVDQQLGAGKVSMSGFVANNGADAMLCATPATAPVFVGLARQYLVCDHWFSSMPGPTWPNRFFVHAASSGGLANSPSSLRSIGAMLLSKVGFSFSNGTLYDRLDASQVGWRVYHGDHFPQVCAISAMPSVFVADPNKFRAMHSFAADCAAGDVAAYTFIEPDYDILSTFKNGDSQHPCGSLSAGEQLIKSVYDALSTSPVWNDSLLVILYDEHGGFYDQLAPGACRPPADQPLNAGKAAQPPNPPFAFDRYGVRVPAVIISPWIGQGVSNVLFDHSSIVRTAFDAFGVAGQLTARDAAAASLLSLLAPTPVAAAPAIPAPAMPAPAAPAAGSSAAAAPPSPPSPQAHVAAIDGFTRVAAQIHHAITQYRPAMTAEGLKASLPPEADLQSLPNMPKSADPAESLAYMAYVASEIDAHRARQGRPPVK
jgi:phospholipase C